MKKFITYIVLFSLVASVTLIAAIGLLGGTGWTTTVVYNLGLEDHTFTRSLEADTTNNIDILFVGSSHCYRTFDTRIFAQHGYRCFNLGSSNQTPDQTLALLELYLKEMNPKLVVFEVHPDIMHYDGIESSLYLLSNLPPSIPLLKMAIKSLNAKVLCTLIYATLQNTLFRRLEHFSEPKTIGVSTYIEGGFVERQLDYYQPHPHSPTDISIRPSQLRALRKCVKLMQRNSTPYIMMRIPETKSLKDSYINDNFNNTIGAIGPYMAISPKGLDDSLHYFDDDHLNQNGVDLMCNYICDSILPTIIKTI